MLKIAVADTDDSYVDHISGVLSREHGELFICVAYTSRERLNQALLAGSFDILLISETMLGEELRLDAARLVLALCERAVYERREQDPHTDIVRLYKFQRISLLVKDVLARYAECAPQLFSSGISRRVRTAAFYSPIGGSGKTTLAFAYARRLATTERVFYLNIENFSSLPALLPAPASSISDVLQRMGKGNAGMLVAAMCQSDAETGIQYFGIPNNYDDIVVMSGEDLLELFAAISESACCDHLIVDLSTQCNALCHEALCAADQIFLITEPGESAAAKVKQFSGQHNLFGKISDRVTVAVNKGGGDECRLQGMTRHIFFPLFPPTALPLMSSALAAYPFTEG